VKKRFMTPFLLAVLLHVVIFIFVFFTISFPSQPTSMPSAAPEQVNVVKAVTVNQAQVDQEMARIQQQNDAAKAAQQAREQRAAQQRVEAKRQQERAEKALAAVKAEQARLTQQKQQQAAQQQKLAQQKAQQAKQQKQQAAQQELQQKLQAEQQELAAANAKRVAGEVNKYNALILNAIYPNWIVNDKQKNLSTDLLINLAPDGSVLNVTVTQSSGSANFDRSAVAAVYKSSPLPVPKDPQAFAQFRQFRLTLKPDNIVSQ
jgi:colicin import membrane protein